MRGREKLRTVEQAGNEYQFVYEQEGGKPTERLKKAIKEYDAAVKRDKATQKNKGVR